jgi:hypothetical protein
MDLIHHSLKRAPANLAQDLDFRPSGISCLSPLAPLIWMRAHPKLLSASRRQQERLPPAPHSLGRSIFGASDLTEILGCFDRARQSRRFFNMFGGLVRLVIGLHQLRLRSLKLFFDRRFPRHFGFSLALHGSNIDPANWLRQLRQILGQRL